MARLWLVAAMGAMVLVPGVLAAPGGGSTTTCSALLPAPLPAPVCATATALIQVSCFLARVQLSCDATATMGGAGASALMLPGDVRWSGLATGEMCLRALPCPTGQRVLASGEASWAGLLVLGPDGAGTVQHVPLASTVIDSPLPGDCIVWSVAASGTATAVVVRTGLPAPAPGSLDQATAQAGSADTGSFCA